MPPDVLCTFETMVERVIPIKITAVASSNPTTKTPPLKLEPFCFADIQMISSGSAKRDSFPQKIHCLEKLIASPREIEIQCSETALYTPFNLTSLSKCYLTLPKPAFEKLKSICQKLYCAIRRIHDHGYSHHYLTNSTCYLSLQNGEIELKIGHFEKANSLVPLMDCKPDLESFLKLVKHILTWSEDTNIGLRLEENNEFKYYSTELTGNLPKMTNVNATAVFFILFVSSRYWKFFSFLEIVRSYGS